MTLHHFTLQGDVDGNVGMDCLICERRAAWPNNDPENLRRWSWEQTETAPGRDGAAPIVQAAYPLMLDAYVAAAVEHLAESHPEVTP